MHSKLPISHVCSFSILDKIDGPKIWIYYSKCWIHFTIPLKYKYEGNRSNIITRPKTLFFNTNFADITSSLQWYAKKIRDTMPYLLANCLFLAETFVDTNYLQFLQPFMYNYRVFLDGKLLILVFIPPNRTERSDIYYNFVFSVLSRPSKHTQIRIRVSLVCCQFRKRHPSNFN